MPLSARDCWIFDMDGTLTVSAHDFEAIRLELGLPPTRGQDSLGSGPLHRAYEANDGWLFVGAHEGQLDAIAAIDGLSGVEDLRGDALERALETRFGLASVDEWVSRLVGVEIGAHRVAHRPRCTMKRCSR